MPTFLLDDATAGVLSGAQFKTQAQDLAGEFREIQLRFYQSVASQDMEVHFLEFHFEWGPISMEDR